MSGEARFKCGGCGSVSDVRRSRHDIPLYQHQENRRRAPARFAKAVVVCSFAVAAAACVGVATENWWYAMASYFAIVAVYQALELET
jgi:hypothetical protein